MRTIIITILFANLCYSQVNWKLYNKDNSPLPSNAVTSVAQDKDRIYWISTLPEIIDGEFIGGGVAKFDGSNWEIFNKNNSPLPTNRISWVTIDSLNRKWFGTYEGGLICYDNNQWKIFNSNNSGLHTNDIYHLAASNDTVVWIATYNHGVAKFDGLTWEIFRQTDFNLGSEKMNFVYPYKDTVWAGVDYGGLIYYSNGIWKHVSSGNYTPDLNLSVMSLAKDNAGFFWSNAYKMNIGWLLAKFKDENFTFYDSTSTGFNAQYSYNSIAVDDSNNKWIGTRNGLLFNNNSVWLKYDSPYDFNGFSFIYIDKNNNKITGCFNSSLKKLGLLFFNENKVILSSSDERRNILAFSLSQNYPNPFNPNTTIVYQLAVGCYVSLKVYDILGREVAILLNEEKPAGTHSVIFNSGSLPTGIYIYRIRTGSYIESKKMLMIK